MSSKRKLQVAVDLAMTVTLLFLMSYSLFGEERHEWLGVLMGILVITHHSLNWQWHRNLGRGRYTPARCLQLIVNGLALVAILCLLGSGIIMSRHVFQFLGINFGAMEARVLHLLGAYWLFVLLSLHIGLHGKLIMGMLRRAIPALAAAGGRWILRLVIGLIAIYGIYAFDQRDLASYMVLKNEFVFFDFSEPLVWFMADYFAIMVLFAVIGYGLAAAVTERGAKHNGNLS